MGRVRIRVKGEVLGLEGREQEGTRRVRSADDATESRLVHNVQARQSGGERGLIGLSHEVTNQSIYVSEVSDTGERK
jgi:hypothetical protein